MKEDAVFTNSVKWHKEQNSGNPEAVKLLDQLAKLEAHRADLKTAREVKPGEFAAVKNQIADVKSKLAELGVSL